MIAELLKGERCRWCGGKLEETYLSGGNLGIDKGERTFWPILCECGGITIIGNWRVEVAEEA